MKIWKVLTGTAVAVVTSVCMAFAAYAKTEDVEMSVARAIQTNGSWGQSITYSRADLDTSRFTPDTTVRVEYELLGEPSHADQHQVELILQNYDVNPQIWAQVVPVEYDDTHAVFDYDGMALAYGSDDFSTVNNVCVGDRGIKMKVTKVTVTNLAVPESASGAEGQSGNEAAGAESGSSLTIIIIVIVAAVVVAGVVVTLIVVKKNKKRFY